MLTNDELKKHFGQSYEYDHAVNLRDRMPENKNHLQPSLDWAKIETQKVKEVLPWIRSGASEFKAGTMAHFERTLEILGELIK